MAISKPIIAGNPAVERGRVVDQRIQTHPAPPGGSYRVRDGASYRVVTVDPPERQGQVYFHVMGDNANKIASMYVGVEIDGALFWANVDLTRKINGLTGKPFDPMFD